MIPFWVALATSLVLTGLAVPLLRRWAVIDRPNSRSSHTLPVPRGGGVAVMLAIVAGTAAAARSDVWPVVVPALLLAIVGLADDLRSLPARLRLAAQVVVGASLCAWLAGAAPDLRPSLAVFLVVGLVGFVGFVNAFNFMDGVNGISALNAVVAGAWFTWLGHDYGLQGLSLIGPVVAGGALGFLPWNATSRVFLGDVGSYGLGALLAGAAIFAWAYGVPIPLAVAPLLVYLADTSWVILRRARAGAPLLEAHREHAYQRLVQQGWPHLGAALWTASVSGAVVLVLASLYPEYELLAFAVTAALLVTYLVTPLVVEKRRAESVEAT